MPEIKVGIQLRGLRQPLKKALHTAARLGAAAVEIDARQEIRPAEMSRTAVRDLRKLLDDLRLRVAALSFFTRRGYDVLDELDRRVEATKQAMQLAYSLGSSVVINHVGRVPADADRPQWDLLVQVLADLGLYGQRAGTQLAAQTGSNDGQALARLIAALPPGSLGVNLDPAALVIQGHSPEQTVADVGAEILHVHVRDAVRDGGGGQGQEVPLGRGSVDFPAVIGALEERGYRGYFTVVRRSTENPEEEIGQAVKYLRNL